MIDFEEVEEGRQHAIDELSAASTAVTRLHKGAGTASYRS
jgi:hypothetical protein